MSHLIIGGARSGKSRFAQTLAESYKTVAFIATAQAFDEEMRERITRHKAERPCNQVLIEEPFELPATIIRQVGKYDVLLIDCLTLWLSNLLCAGKDVSAYKNTLLYALKNAETDIILVSNEVGAGIVPENALARKFRDDQGALNREIGDIVGRVSLIIAGFEVKLKEARH